MLLNLNPSPITYPRVSQSFCSSVPHWHFYRFLCTATNEDFEKKNYVVESGWRLHHVLNCSGYSLGFNVPCEVYKCITCGKWVNIPQIGNPM